MCPVLDPAQASVTSSTSPRGCTVGAMAWALRSARSVSTSRKELARPHPAMSPLSGHHGTRHRVEGCQRAGLA
eukprot:870703-Pyramimonas_sp.AAC.1